jgi:hypothetical protein
VLPSRGAEWDRSSSEDTRESNCSNDQAEDSTRRSCVHDKGHGPGGNAALAVYNPVVTVYTTRSVTPTLCIYVWI